MWGLSPIYGVQGLRDEGYEGLSGSEDGDEVVGGVPGGPGPGNQGGGSLQEQGGAPEGAVPLGNFEEVVGR